MSDEKSVGLKMGATIASGRGLLDSLTKSKPGGSHAGSTQEVKPSKVKKQTSKMPDLIMSSH